MATPTLEDIASWPVPDYENPHDPLDAVIYGVNIPLMTLMTLFVGGRFVSRTFLVRNALGVDDWTMLLAYILAMAMGICQIILLRWGLGRHMYDVQFEWLPQLGKMTVAVQAMFGPASAITKISICLTYLRLFPSKTNKWFCYLSMFVLSGFGISVMVTMILQCQPMSDVWNVLKADKNCIDTERFFIAVAALNSFTDFAVYLWPVHYLWKVKLSLAKRIGLIICFGIGVLICIAGIIRITWQVTFAHSWDQSYNGAIIFLIVAVEINLGVICGCLPGVRPLATRIFPSLGSSTTYASGRTPGSYGHSNNVSSKGMKHSHSGHGNEFRDMNSIRVTKDVELSVYPHDTSNNSRGRGAGRSDSEEWIFHP